MIAAHNAADHLDQLIVLTERLTDLMVHQAQAFEQQRPQDVAASMEETSKLANIYRHESARIRQAPRLLEGAPVDQRMRLVRATEAFDAVLARHGRAVNAAKTVTEGLVRALAEEVASQRQKGVAYGANATTAQAAALAITLNRRA